jgi:tetratricopeptide (TPR) repeat protein
VRLNLGGLCEDQARYAEAENLYHRSITLKEQLFGPDHPDVALAVGNLGVLYAKQGRYAEASDCYRRALDIFEATLAPDHPKRVTCRENYEDLLQAMQRQKENP